ncbi:uncharacterized protein [Asterias amurensis]|uniref:uncharacterized protein n=1 Tax=Asterias amurensis TaxID=7602 RepID=UPI003AB2C81A
MRSQCPRGFGQYYEGHCYRFVTDRPLPWRQARKECQKAPGGELAIAKKHPVSESQFLLGRVQTKIKDLWIGLFHDSQTGVWRWVDDTPLSEKQGQVWNLGEPNNPRGRENCAGISFQAKWNDSDCSENLPYVCEIQENSECYTNVNGNDYNGHVKISATGNKCVEWNRDDLRALNVDPISDVDWLKLRGHNHCRNPGGFRDSTWCVVERRNSGSVSWKPCYIGEPQVTCVQGDTRSSVRRYATPCTVEDSCSNGHTCHPVMRECICPSGYQGIDCLLQCRPGTYGYQCDLTCPSCPGGVTCHHVTGSCLEVNTEVTESNGGNRHAGSCSGICVLAVKVGCVCDNTSGSCPCPAYVIAVLAVAIVTWVVLGFACLACGILRRRRNGTRVEYKRDSDYCEEIGTDSDTDDELQTQQVPGHPTNEIVSQPAIGMTVGVMDKFESSTRALLHDTSHGRPPPVPTAPLPTTPVRPSDSPPNDTTPPESPFYLNVTRYRDETEYSNPYEFFGREPVWRRSAPGPDEVWEPFLFRPVPNHDELNNAPNGYVNDSVIKLKEKKRLNKHGHPMPYRLRFSFRSKELDSNGGVETQHKRTFRQKPALKPKPDNIKLRPPFSGKCLGGTRVNSAGATTLTRRSDPQSGATRHDEFELKIIGQHSPIATRNGDTMRRHKIQRGTSVPNSGSSCKVDPDIVGMNSPWSWRDGKSSDGHVYVNEKIGRPRVVGKARSVDEFGA